MKRFLLSAFLLICLSVFGLAQEKPHKNINIVTENVGEELQLQTSFNQPFIAGYSIFKTVVKQKGDTRIDSQIQIPEGNDSVFIDTSTLPKGEYFIELYTKEKGRIFRSIFIKE